jgi:hypothetical protein
MQKFSMNKIERRFSEEVGLHLCFYERRMRGSEQISCVVEVMEYGSEVDVELHKIFDSWDKVKKDFPTLKDMLIDLSYDVRWDASWRNHDRILFIESIEGHEGLYDVDETVFYDLTEKNVAKHRVVEEKKQKTKKPKK